MIDLTDAQRNTLDKMPGYVAVLQFETGAVLVVKAQEFSTARVLTPDGRLLNLGDYLQRIIDQAP
jgi:hypothetical protein